MKIHPEGGAASAGPRRNKVDMRLDSINHSRLSEKAYRGIKEFLFSPDFRMQQPGGKVDEKVLIERLNMSRTPVREAINRLAAEGFLQVIPYKGVFIAQKTKEEVISILMVRATLEGMAARLATSHFTPKDFAKMRALFEPFLNCQLEEKRFEFTEANIAFHEFIMKHTKCKVLIDITNSLYDQMRLIRFRTSAYVSRLESALAQHLQLVDAFEQRDPARAENLMRAHIEESSQYIVDSDSPGQSYMLP